MAKGEPSGYQYVTDLRHIKCLEMLMAGETVTDISKACEVARKTIYEWMDREEFQAEYQRLVAMQRTSLERALSAMSQSVASTIRLGLSEELPTSRVTMAKYVADRILGAPTQTVSTSERAADAEARAWLKRLNSDGEEP
jgi:hypothetical protein